MVVELIKPSETFLNSYYEACVESWDYVHDRYILHNPEHFAQWKHTIFEDYSNNEKGINLPEGFVPSTTFWIIDGNEYIGTINIRHRLTDLLKKYGGHAGVVIRLSKRGQGYGKIASTFIFEEAKKIITSPLIVTCQATNTKSFSLIEKTPYSKKETEEIELYGQKQLIYRYYFEF